MKQRERHYKDPKLNAAADELWSYRQRQFELRRMREKREEYRERYSIGAISYDGIRVDGGTRRDKLVEIAVIWADLDVEIHLKEAQAERELWRILDKLQMLSCVQRQVLELYYIKGYSVLQISEMMAYSEVHIKRIKFEALKQYAYLNYDAQ